MTNGAGRGEYQRVAVGLGLGDLGGADIAPGAGLVLDQDALPEPRRQPLRHDTRNRVAGAARTERHHELDRPRRVGLRCRVIKVTNRGSGTRQRTWLQHEWA